MTKVGQWLDRVEDRYYVAMDNRRNRIIGGFVCSVATSGMLVGVFSGAQQQGESLSTGDTIGLIVAGAIGGICLAVGEGAAAASRSEAAARQVAAAETSEPVVDLPEAA